MKRTTWNIDVFVMKFMSFKYETSWLLLYIYPKSKEKYLKLSKF